MKKSSRALLLFGAVLSLGVSGGSVFAGVGAVTPFTSYEAESGQLGAGAAVVAVTASPTTRYSSPELEASGHAYVQLTTTGQYVERTNTTGQALTAINLRCCIPDAPTGGGISSTLDLYVDGAFRQAFSVSSQQNYCYEGTNYNGQIDKNPVDGNPRGFWNDTHAFVTGAAINPGDTIRFQKDAANGAAFYYVDVIDLETPPPALAQPPGSLSITSYGALANNIGVDNTTFINNCFNAARSQGKIAWIPPGTFYFSAIHGGLNATGITIVGAGPWYSTLYRVTPANNTQGVANIITTISCTLSNVSLDCNGSSRAGNNNNGAVNFYGTNWVVDNVWIQHVTSAFWCAGVGGIACNCRVLDVWSDGGNFNNVQSDNGIGMSLTYSNNFVRGTGDDAMAINSVNYNVYGSTTNYYTIMRDVTYANNTAVGAWGGKGIGIYGGVNDVVTNNLLQDTARYMGLGVMKFGVNGSDLLSATVMGNVMLRCGGNGYNEQQQGMMIGNGGDGQGSGVIANAYCASNTIIDALYSGVGFSTSSNIVFQYNSIIDPGLDGIAIGPPNLGSGVVGTAIINSNTVVGLNPGRVVFTNSAIAYAGIFPVGGADYDSMLGVTPQPCSEGGMEIGNIGAGDWAAYNNLNLTGVNAFVARVASTNSSGAIEVHLDSASGTLIGTCQIPISGGLQTYSNTYCSISGSSGTHNVSLVFTGGSGNLCSMEFFALFTAPPALSHQLVIGNTYSLKALVNGKYVSADNNGTNALIAKSASEGVTEQFKVVDAGGGNIGLQALVNSNYVCADNNGSSPLIANRTAVGLWETFTEVDARNGNIGLRALNNGRYVTAPNGGASPLIAQSTNVGTQESFQVGFVSGVPPAQVGGLTAISGNSQVALSWLAPLGATGYNVKRSTSGTGPFGIIASNLAGLTYTNIGVNNGTTYYYVVSALNPAGESTNSAPVGATPGSLDRSGWVATASSTESGGSPYWAIDGNITTRWSTGAQQTSGQWFQVDMDATNTFYELVLDAGSSTGDYPRGYQVNLSNDGNNWSGVIASGAGTSPGTTITFPTQAARFIRITQTGSVSGLWWSIHEFNVIGTVGTVPLPPAGLTAVAGDGEATLAWNASANAAGYNVKRSTAFNGTYVVVATNIPATGYTETGLNNGTTYYFVISAVNAAGQGSDSAPVSVQPVSMTPPQVAFGVGAGALQIYWPQDHVGWTLQIQTNSPGAGLGTNWVAVPASRNTNQFVLPFDPGNGSVFVRLAYP